MSEPVLGRAFVLTLPEDGEDEGRLFLVGGRQHGDAFLHFEGEERPEEGLRMLERRKLGQIPLEDEEGLWIRVPEPLDLLEQPLPDERIEEVRQRLPFDSDGSEDVVARRDLLDLNRDAELPQAVRNVLGLVRVDDQRDPHVRPNRRSDVNVPVRGASAALAKPWVRILFMRPRVGPHHGAKEHTDTPRGHDARDD